MAMREYTAPRGGPPATAVCVLLARNLSRIDAPLRPGVRGSGTIDDGAREGVVQTTAFQVEDGRIVALYTVRNPDKVAHLLS
jgi:hypothetical protein